MAHEKRRHRVFNFRIVRYVVRSSGLGPMTAAFVGFFCLCSLIVWLADPALGNYGDALWCCFQAVTTIGFGDIAVTAPLGRFTIVALSITSLFVLAILTGVVVNYTTEVIKSSHDESLAEFMDRLEHLPELSQEELRSLSDAVKRRRQG